MAIPAWTREWRPLARQLCGRMGPRNSAEDDPQTPQDQETLLLRADRVVGRLYAHRFADSLPQDVARQTQALATKFRVQSLEDRAQKLLRLSQQCDAQVLKLLLELARAPTKASDEDVAVDEHEDSRWTQVLQEEKGRVAKQRQMQDRLVEELFEISTNDEWFQAWDESEDESDWETSSADDNSVEKSDGGRQRHAKRSSEVLEEEKREDQVRTSLDSRVSGVLASCDDGEKEQMEEQRHEEEARREEFSEEIEIRDEVLRRYYPEVEVSDSSLMEMDDAAVEDLTCVLEKRDSVQFRMDRPWLLCSTVAKSTECSPMRTDILPQRLIHEKTVVHMVLAALEGVESLFFELCPVKPTPTIFSADFQTKIVQRSQQSFNVAVSHLSPLALEHMLETFAHAASEMQLLRDFLSFIHRNHGLHEQHRCVTLEGLANSLSKIMWSLSAAIRNVMQPTSTPVGFQEEDPNPWSGSAARQSTLLGSFGGLKETFGLVSWLKRVLVRCFQDLSRRHWHEVRRAEQATCVLSALYHVMEVEYMEGLPVEGGTNTAGSWSRYDILLYLFTGALNPYLDLLNGMIFERGHFETIPLDRELFFATPALLSVGSSPMRTERNQSFREGLMALAPFEVNHSLVPKFLEPATELMNEALASRQLKNHFLQHQQYSRDESLKIPEPPQPSLRELFTADIEAMGCTRSALETSVPQKVERVVPSSQLRVLDSMPFNRVLMCCLTEHINSKCRELNCYITDIFRDKLCFVEHVEALRMFVLMKQQDAFRSFSERLIAEMLSNPVAWTISDRISALHQSAVQETVDNSSLSSLQRQLGDRICVRIDANQLNILGGARNVDIANMKCMSFTFFVQHPLRVLFSTNIMEKYSRLGVFLVQVKAVESALVKFKFGFRNRRCYSHIEGELREPLIQLANMLHYTKSLLNYLTSQISEEGWSKYRQVLESSRSLAEIDGAHEQYLDLLLNRFFLLDKHATVIQYILTTFNHILRFVRQVDEFVKAVERNLIKYFPEQASRTDRDQTGDAIAHARLLDHPDFRVVHGEMKGSSKEFKRQSHFLVVMLTAMQKHGASPHVSEIVTQLNYNYFYHQKERTARTKVPVQKRLSRSGSMHD